MRKNISLTRRELDIMSVLWRVPQATVAEVRDALADDLAYPTVQTMLRVLEGKGYVRHHVDGRTFVFSAIIGADSAADSMLQRLISKAYHGSHELLLMRLLDSRRISKAELLRLRATLERKLDEVDEP